MAIGHAFLFFVDKSATFQRNIWCLFRNPKHFRRPKITIAPWLGLLEIGIV